MDAPPLPIVEAPGAAVAPSSTCTSREYRYGVTTPANARQQERLALRRNINRRVSMVSGTYG